MRSHWLWIDGQWTDSQGGGRMTIENPASEQPLAEVVDASRAESENTGKRVIETASKTLKRVHLELGGKPDDRSAGYYIEPAVITGAAQDSEIIQSEVFGPVLTISPFKDTAEAVALANDVAYGLAASLFAKDVGRAMKLAAELEFGTVWINDHIPLTSETPHGGFKHSGFGKDLSAEAMGDYQITKHVMVNLAS